MRCRIKQGFPSGKTLLQSPKSSARVKKLKETLVAVQQLEKKMSSLRSWLAHIEMELSRPIVYDACDEKEIEKKLNQQQVNQRSSTYLCSFIICIINFTSTYRRSLAFAFYANYNCTMIQLVGKGGTPDCRRKTPFLFKAMMF